MKISYLIIILIIIVSCSSVKECPPNQNEGNPGSMFNTEYDEYAPVFYDNLLYFTTLNPNKPDQVRILYSEFIDGKYESPALDMSLPINYYPNSGLPAFFKSDGAEYVIIAGMNGSGSKISSDLFLSKREGGKWSIPQPLKNLNTDYYESYPSISQDGKMMFFASDRPNGEGGIDIYVSIGYSPDNWSEPMNLGKLINTSEDEIAPYISKNSELFYSSKGKGGLGGFDILRASQSESGWNEPQLLREPFNSTANEAGAAFNDGKLILASDRRGGCGGKDLYMFTLCGPVIYKGVVKSQAANVPLEGTAILLDENKNELKRAVVDNSGNFQFTLNPSVSYYVRYFNSCVSNYVPEQKFTAPCSDTSAMKLTSNFILPDNLKQFDFADYKVPFFVTGYYQPNTVDNLNALRLKFSYNIFSKKESVKYIENPGAEYDEYSKVVEEALNEASSYIISMLENLDADCMNKNPKLKIRVTGYADPRPISETSTFEDESINDGRFGIEISKGSKIDNQILSRLRAYYTAKYLENYLKNQEVFIANYKNIDWEIIGSGIDESEMNNELKRRVNIEIGMEVNSR